MHFLKKINLKKYFLSLFILNLVAALFVQDKNDLYGGLIILIATLCNHVLLIEGVTLIVLNQKNLTPKAVLFRAIPIFLGKILILVFGIYIGVHFMGPRVIIPVILYVISIFILVLSIKKVDRLEKEDT